METSLKTKTTSQEPYYLTITNVFGRDDDIDIEQEKIQIQVLLLKDNFQGMKGEMQAPIQCATKK